MDFHSAGTNSMWSTAHVHCPLPPENHEGKIAILHCLWFFPLDFLKRLFIAHHFLRKQRSHLWGPLMPPVHSYSSESRFSSIWSWARWQNCLYWMSFTSSVSFFPLSLSLLSHFPSRIQPKSLACVWQNYYRLEDYYMDSYSLSQQKTLVWKYSRTT